jgi:hypothetical protein
MMWGTGSHVRRVIHPIVSVYLALVTLPKRPPQLPFEHFPRA